MARKGENIYKRKDGRFEGRYIKCYDENGKPKYSSVYGKTKKEVREKLIFKNKEIKTEKPIISSSMRLGDWISKWILTQRQIKDSTKVMYNSHIKNHIQGSIGNIMLKNLTEDIIQNFIDDETEKYAPKTVHSIFSMLKLSLEAAHKKQFVGTVYVGIRLPKVRQKTVRVLTKQEQKRLDDAILNSNNRYDIGILVCLYTGIRIGELCALKWTDINFKNKTLTVDKTVQRVKNDNNEDKKKTKIKFDEPKSLSSVRTIPMPQFLVNELKKYRREDGYILRDNGCFTDTRNISRRFKKLLEQAEIDDLNFHILRHSFATRALELGFDAKTLSEILGHSSVTITLNLYAHSLPEHKRKEMEKFSGLFKRQSDKQSE